MEDKIKDAIEKIRPVLQGDGGDISFVEVTSDNVVRVQLHGHCANCPGATMTLRLVVEKILKQAFPEIKSVEAV